MTLRQPSCTTFGHENRPRAGVAPTERERETLRWLIATCGTSRYGFTGRSLVPFYKARYVAKRLAEDPGAFVSPSVGKGRAWQQVGGRVLRRLWEKGLLDIRGHDRDTSVPRYVLNDAGREFGE